ARRSVVRALLNGLGIGCTINRSRQQLRAHGPDPWGVFRDRRYPGTPFIEGADRANRDLRRGSEYGPQDGAGDRGNSDERVILVGVARSVQGGAPRGWAWICVGLRGTGGGGRRGWGGVVVVGGRRCRQLLTAESVPTPH